MEIYFFPWALGPISVSPKFFINTSYHKTKINNNEGELRNRGNLLPAGGRGPAHYAAQWRRKSLNFGNFTLYRTPVEKYSILWEPVPFSVSGQNFMKFYFDLVGLQLKAHHFFSFYPNPPGGEGAFPLCPPGGGEIHSILGILLYIERQWKNILFPGSLDHFLWLVKIS